MRRATASQNKRKWEEAIACIGSDSYPTYEEQRAKALGLRTDKDGNFQGFVSF